MKFNLLIAEDTRVNLELYRSFIKVDEWEYTTPSDLRSFEDHARRAKFDGYIFDINLESWGADLAVALGMIPDESLVFFASFEWAQHGTLQVLSRAVVVIREKRLVLAGTIDLQAVKANNTDVDSAKKYIKSVQGNIDMMLKSRTITPLLKKTEPNCIRILHVSDSQYCDPGTDNWSKFVGEEISRYVQQSLNLEIDLLALTGDISFSGQPHEFSKASSELKLLARSLWPNESGAFNNRILLVPGNHDVNFRLAASEKVLYSVGKKSLALSTDGSEVPELQRFGLAPFRDFARSLLGFNRYSDEFQCTAVVSDYESFGVRFHLLNSVTSLSCRDPSTPSVDVAEPKRLMSENLIPMSHAMFGVSLAHHGLHPIDSTTVQNREEVASYLQANSIRLHVHGHGHAWSAQRMSYLGKSSQKHSGQLNQNEFVQVMAPTTHLNGDLRPIGELRGFNLITLNIENEVVKECDIRSYCWNEKFVERSRVTFRI